MEVKCSCITVTYNYTIKTGKNKGNKVPKTVIYRSERFEIKHADTLSREVCGLPCDIEVVEESYDYDESHPALIWSCSHPDHYYSDGPFQYKISIEPYDNAADFEELSKWINYNLINMNISPNE